VRRRSSAGWKNRAQNHPSDFANGRFFQVSVFSRLRASAAHSLIPSLTIMAETREYNVDKILDDRQVKVRLHFCRQPCLPACIFPESSMLAFSA
jgi:hypothetical protein